MKNSVFSLIIGRSVPKNVAALALMILFAFLPARGWSQFPYTGTLTADNDPGSTNSSEAVSMLFDNDKSTKWCVYFYPAFGTYDVIFHSASAFHPTHYILTTAANSGEASRRPKSWKIYGGSSASGSWTQLASVTNDSNLPEESNAFYTYTLNSYSGNYQYFKFEISANQGDEYLQLAEFRFMTAVTDDSGTTVGSASIVGFVV